MAGTAPAIAVRAGRLSGCGAATFGKVMPSVQKTCSYSQEVEMSDLVTASWQTGRQSTAHDSSRRPIVLGTCFFELLPADVGAGLKGAALVV